MIRLVLNLDVTLTSIKCIFFAYNVQSMHNGPSSYHLVYFADMPQFKQKISSKHARLHTLRQCNDFECRQACETFFC